MLSKVTSSTMGVGLAGEPQLGRRIGGERIASPGKVIELVFVGIFSCSQTPRQKSPSCEGRPEFHDFCFVAMPNDERVVDHRVGNGRSVLHWWIGRLSGVS